jgi:hypothetical protein
VNLQKRKYIPRDAGKYHAAVQKSANLGDENPALRER